MRAQPWMIASRYIYAWLREVLSRMLDGHPQQHLNQLLPWSQAYVLRLSLAETEAPGPGRQDRRRPQT